MSLYPISSAIGQESQESNDVSLEKAPLCDAETYAAGECSLADDTSVDDTSADGASGVAQAPLYASLFPGATAWNKAVAFFGGVAALAAKLGPSLATLLPFTQVSHAESPDRNPVDGPLPAELFDREKLNEPWTGTTLPEHLTVLVEAFDWTMSRGVYDERIKNNVEAHNALTHALTELRTVLASTPSWDHHARLLEKVEQLRSVTEQNAYALHSADNKVNLQLELLADLMIARCECARLSVLNALSTGDGNPALYADNIADASAGLRRAYSNLLRWSWGDGLRAVTPYRLWALERISKTVADFSPALQEAAVAQLLRELHHGEERLSFLRAVYPVRGPETPNYWRLLGTGHLTPESLAQLFAEVEQVEASLRAQGKEAEATAWRRDIDAMVNWNKELRDLPPSQFPIIPRFLFKIHIREALAWARQGNRDGSGDALKTALVYYAQLDLDALPAEERLGYRRDTVITQAFRALQAESCGEIRSAIRDLEPIAEDARDRGELAVAAELALKILELGERHDRLKAGYVAQVEDNQRRIGDPLIKENERNQLFRETMVLLGAADELPRMKRAELDYARRYRNQSTADIVQNIAAFMDANEPGTAAEILVQDVFQLGRGGSPDPRAFERIRTVYDALVRKISSDAILELLRHVDPAERRAALLMKARCDREGSYGDAIVSLKVARVLGKGSAVEEQWIQSELNFYETQHERSAEARALIDDKARRWTQVLGGQVVPADRGHEAWREYYTSEEASQLHVAGIWLETPLEALKATVWTRLKAIQYRQNPSEPLDASNPEFARLRAIDRHFALGLFETDPAAAASSAADLWLGFAADELPPPYSASDSRQSLMSQYPALMDQLDRLGIDITGDGQGMLRALDRARYRLPHDTSGDALRRDLQCLERALVLGEVGQELLGVEAADSEEAWRRSARIPEAPRAAALGESPRMRALLSKPAPLGLLKTVLASEALAERDRTIRARFAKFEAVWDAHPGLDMLPLTTQIDLLGVDRGAFLKQLDRQGMVLWFPPEIAFQLAAAALDKPQLISPTARARILGAMKKLEPLVAQATRGEADPGRATAAEPVYRGINPMLMQPLPFADLHRVLGKLPGEEAGLGGVLTYAGLDAALHKHPDLLTRPFSQLLDFFMPDSEEQEKFLETCEREDWTADRIAFELFRMEGPEADEELNRRLREKVLREMEELRRPSVADPRAEEARLRERDWREGREGPKGAR